MNGFEPTTSCMSSKRSNQLSYTHVLTGIFYHNVPGKSIVFLFFSKKTWHSPSLLVLYWMFGALAQLGAHNTGSVGVTGSSPVCSTTQKDTFTVSFLCRIINTGLEAALRKQSGGLFLAVTEDFCKAQTNNFHLCFAKIKKSPVCSTIQIEVWR